MGGNAQKQLPLQRSFHTSRQPEAHVSRVGSPTLSTAAVHPPWLDPMHRSHFQGSELNHTVFKDLALFLHWSPFLFNPLLSTLDKRIFKSDQFSRKAETWFYTTSRHGSTTGTNRALSSWPGSPWGWIKKSFNSTVSTKRIYHTTNFETLRQSLSSLQTTEGQKASNFTQMIPTVWVQWTSPTMLPRDNASRITSPSLVDNNKALSAQALPSLHSLPLYCSETSYTTALKQQSATFFSLPLKLTRWGCFFLQTAWNYTNDLTD